MSPAYSLRVVAACALTYALTAATVVGAPARSSMRTPSWKQIDQLVSDQKLEEAQQGAKARLGQARAAADEGEWTHALIKVVQLEVGLHGYETAVRILREESWPKGAVSQVTLNLFYAAVLDTYAAAYGWEINQREKVESKGPVDLKAWTMDQIRAEENRAYLGVWERRKELGNEPTTLIKEYVQPGNYPPGIRDSLRDAVSYLWVQMLGNTSTWRPEHANDVFRLNLPALLQGDPAASALLKLDDPDVHPLLKIGAILDDLESWHAQKGKRGAALEARLERLRHLNTSFSDTSNRKLIRDSLAQRLTTDRDLPWFSVGMHELASYWQQAGNLVRAHEIAQKGAVAYPDSLGGQMCLSLYKGIEAPELQMLSMSGDGPGKRSIQITHRNLPTVFFKAYAVDLDKRISTAQDYNLLPNEQDFRRLLASGRPAAEWKVELPATPDFQNHLTFVTPPLRDSGLYVVLASGSRTWNFHESRIDGLDFIVTGLVITTRQDRDTNTEVTVLAGETGAPVAGATVELWRFDYNHAHSRSAAQTTDAHGVANFPFDAARQQNNYFLVARKDHQVAVEANGLNFYRWRQPPSRDPASMVFTDRSIYRPQQKVLWKVVAYAPEGEVRYKVLEGSPVTVSLKDPNSQVVASATVTTNAFGSASGEFTVPTGRLLGNWRIETSLRGGAAFRVEEYKRPTFEATFKDPESPLRLNKPATLVGAAKYYFGLPVTNGTVKWRVTRQAVFPWWWYYWFTANTQAQVIATGTSQLSDDGSFKVSFTPEADEKQAQAKDLTYSYAVSADVTDEGGETRSASHSYRLGFVSVEARVSMDDGFSIEGAPAALSISRTNLDGVGRPGKGSWRIVQLKQPDRASAPADLPMPRPPPLAEDKDAPPAVRTPGDRLRPRWNPDYNPDALMADWSDGAQQSQGELVHGADGSAKLSVPGLAAGAYRLRYETKDDFGAKYETFQDFVVAGRQTPLALPAVLRAQKTAVKAGETARFLVASGLTDQPLVFDVYRAGLRVDRRYLTAGRDLALVEVPVREEDRGGFTVVLTTLRDFQLMRFEASIFVPWDDKELKVAFSSFRDKIRPGGTETWRVTVKSETGKDPAPGAVELLSYMFDQSLDIFGPHSPPSVMSLYPSRMGADSVRSSLGQQWGSAFYDTSFPSVPGSPSLLSDRVIFLDNYGVGGPGRRGGLKAFAMRSPVSSAAPAPPPAEAVADVSKPEDKREETKEKAPAKQPPVAPAQGPAAAQPTVELRTNFSETAYWKPQLVTAPDGSASIEFTVPDSVTSWNVWVHAITKDLRGGSVQQHTRSVKDLMVRPYLPRFLREGDQAAIKVVVNNASDKPLSGQLVFDIIDTETDKSVLSEFGLTGDARRSFKVEPGKGTDLTFPITAPKRVGQVAFKVIATSGDLSDGELRPMPLLPSRMHLAQSRFVALHDKDKRTMTFQDLQKNDDPTRIDEQLVVTVDAQLFYTVLQALPYLTHYPYECSEQTLNRFVSTGIVSALYKDYPAVQRMAQKMSKRDTMLETWDAADPNRKMALEETPWLLEAKGGAKAGADDVNMLDARITVAERDSAIAKLKKSQTSGGGFPWFPGGPPSPYMTLYVMHGLARAAEFGVAIPKDVVQRGWQYLAQHVRAEYLAKLRKDEVGWEFLTFLNYTASAYPDESYTGGALTMDERKQILEYSFKHWKQHSPYLKGFLALTLNRMGRREDGIKVWDSVMDSAKTTQDEGTFWAREDRSWLWYNDTIETHAFALRTLMELMPQDARRHGLVQWLLLSKKLSHWKSTRATAEVIYSLVKYLQKEGALGIREDAQVAIGPKQFNFVFEPDEYTGKKNQIVIPGPEMDPKLSSTITVEKSSKGFVFASATWQFSTDKLPAEERGDFFSISRTYFKREKQGREAVLRPLAEGAMLAVGDELEVQISIRTKHEAEYVHLRDPRGAGMEPENAVSRYKWDLGIGWYEETRDSGTNFFFEWLPVGHYTFKYRLRANLAGNFRVGPATIQSMYAPEFNAYSAGHMLKVAEAK